MLFYDIIFLSKRTQLHVHVNKYCGSNECFKISWSIKKKTRVRIECKKKSHHVVIEKNVKKKTIALGETRELEVETN